MQSWVPAWAGRQDAGTGPPALGLHLLILGLNAGTRPSFLLLRWRCVRQGDQLVAVSRVPQIQPFWEWESSQQPKLIGS